MTNYKTGIHYTKDQLESIRKWWQTHRQYDINEYDDYIEIVERDKDLVKQDLRAQRETECFPYINRGKLWYDSLTELQRSELSEWYSAWLNVTETFVVPQKPEWL